MLPVDVLMSFTLAAAVLALVPGPDNIFVMMQAVLHGRMSGVWVTLGLCCGLLVHTTAVALGVAAVFQHYAWAFQLLKLCGALYLGYLAWQAFRAKPQSLGAEQPEKLPRNVLFTRGIIMNVTNPKVSIFFLAFLPQFADPHYGPLMPQIFLLGSVFLLTALIIFCGIAYMATFFRRVLLQSQVSQSYLNKISGLVFCALAIRLLISER